MNQATNFVRYNNAVPIAFSLVVFLAAGTFAASPEIRKDVAASIISSESAVQSVDNTRLLAANLADFEFKPQIVSVTEDNENYYVGYSFKTFLLEDHIWQIKDKAGKITSAKVALAGRDLGDYVAEELKEVIDYERSYLTDTQNIEKANGATQKVVTTTYSGLIGKFLDEKQETFPGYVEVVKAPEPVVAQTELPSMNPQAQATVVAGADSGTPQNELTADYIRSIVKEMLAQSSQAQGQETVNGGGIGVNISSSTTTVPDATTTTEAGNGFGGGAAGEGASVTSEAATTTASQNPPVAPANLVPAGNEPLPAEGQTPSAIQETGSVPPQE